MAKFLVIHPNVDIYGGGERVCYHIIKTLVNHGQQVELLAFDFDIDYYNKIMGEKLPDEVTVNMLGNRKIVEAEPPLSVYKHRQNIINLLKKYKKTANYDYTFSTQTLSAFETELFNTGKNFAYVHFPEIPYDYEHSKRSKQLYLLLYKKMLERHLNKLTLIFCNSKYTKEFTEKYWCKLGIPEPIVVYPPVEEPYWSNKPLSERTNRVVYIARFIPQKRHDILKQLSITYPQIEFVSIGLLRETEQDWFNDFSKNLPENYTLKPNISETEKISFLHDSTIYCHLMEGEHFGIAPMEALASGCVPLVHNSGGMREFIPEEFRWNTIESLKEKILEFNNLNNQSFLNMKMKDLQETTHLLKPNNFEDTIWINVSKLIHQYEN
ncbi:MAG: glycosyltransferase [Candidatus Bathyarchaeota archaeon]|nr:glycosyltransferase [Candidatus Bathyarchaeota archaeon]